jgi:hypothetical protein
MKPISNLPLRIGWVRSVSKSLIYSQKTDCIQLENNEFEELASKSSLHFEWPKSLNDLQDQFRCTRENIVAQKNQLMKSPMTECEIGFEANVLT